MNINVLILFLCIAVNTHGMHKKLFNAVKTKDGYLAEHLLCRDGQSVINERGDDGKSLLQWAIVLDDRAMVTLLLDYGADPNRLDKNGGTPLHSAALNGNPVITELLLVRGAQKTINQADFNGFVPLHHAAFYNYVAIIRLLLAYGAKESISYVAKNGLTPLETARSQHRLEAAIFLKCHGAV